MIFPIIWNVDRCDALHCIIPYAFSGVGDVILKMIIYLSAPYEKFASNLVLERTAKCPKPVGVNVPVVPFVAPLLRVLDEVFIVGIDDERT